MESLFSQIAPALEQHAAPSSTSSGPPNLPTSINPEALAPAALILRSIAPKVQTADPPPKIKSEDEVSELFGQLALDEYGHMRSSWTERYIRHEHIHKEQVRYVCLEVLYSFLF